MSNKLQPDQTSYFYMDENPCTQLKQCVQLDSHQPQRLKEDGKFPYARVKAI